MRDPRTAAAQRAVAPDLTAALKARLRAGDVPVPPYPAVAAALQRTVSGKNVAVPEIAAIVGADAGLAAAVLRQANSAALAGPARIVALEQAIFRLGTAELVRLAFASTIGQVATAPGPLATLRRRAWRHALVAATLAKELAPRRGLEAGQASLAGLLHDFGEVVVLACLEEMGRPEPLARRPEAEWQAIVDELHVEFGMVAAARWRLPDPIAEVIANHHYPDACLRVYRPLVQLVGTCDRVNRALDRDPSAGVAALADVAGLDGDERARIAAILPRVAEQMARLEDATAPAAAAPAAAAPTAVVHATVDDAAPVDFGVRAGRHTYRAVFVTHEAIGFKGAAALAPNWLTELVLDAPAGPISMLANVRSCDVLDGEHVITAQPFGLDGPDKAAWLALVKDTRTQLKVARGTSAIAILPRR